uniref:Bcl-2 Bcl-2 homology region 1-3 domain-containing protein n=1 Tax=Otolemur garnettii TaxID=30611 RepID=H0XHA5_OTOGA
LPDQMEAQVADAVKSPEGEVASCEPEPLKKQPEGLPLLEFVGEAGNGPSTDTLPSTPPPAEEEDELYWQSMEIISRYLWEQETGEDINSLSRVMAHVFSYGVTNWGRIMTLIFGGFVAKHLKTINQEGYIKPLEENIADVLVRTKPDWLVKQRGWDGFVEFFYLEDLESSVRNVLLAFAGVAGVGAGLTYLIR